MYHYAGNNPVRYTDPDGRQTSPIFYSWKNYFEGIFKGTLYGCRAFYADLFGKFGNICTPGVELDSFYADAEVLVGPISLTGTFTIGIDGVSFEFSKPKDMLLSEIENLIDMPITIDTSSISLELPVYENLIDINAVIGIEVDEDNNKYKLKLGGKVGKEADITKVIRGGISVGAGVNMILKPSNFFATAKNGKSDKLNEDLKNANHYYSIDFFMQSLCQ